MRQWSIMRQLSCYGFQNQFRSESVKSILFCFVLYIVTETWGYTFKPPTRKMTKEAMVWIKKISFMCDLLSFSSRSFSYEFGNLSNYFWGNDISLFSLLRKLFGHFNRSILRISSHVKWEFFVNAKNVVAFFVVLCGAN